MRATILKEAKPAEEDPLTLTDLPIPPPGPGEVRVRVRACAVCHTDLHLVEGELPLPVLPYALRVLRKGGTLAINAIHMSPIPEIGYELLYGERTIRSVTNLTRRDAEEFLQVAAGIPVRIDVETYTLEEANAVLLRLKRGEIRGAAVLRT